MLGAILDTALIWDEHAEKSLLGCVILDPKFKVRFNPEWFFGDLHRTIWKAAILHPGGDIVLLIREIERIDGAFFSDPYRLPYLNEIIEFVPHAIHAQYYADLVKEAFVRRQVQEMALEMFRLASSRGEDIVETLRMVYRRSKHLGTLAKPPEPEKPPEKPVDPKQKAK